MKVEELLGFASGLLLAPAAALGSLVRGGRVVHRNGVVLRAQVTPSTTAEGAAEIASRLSGPALVRLSSALWDVRREARPDLLGAAIRFRKESAISPEPALDDQDLIFATIPSALLTGAAMFTTEVHSFLWNDYHAIGVFETPELGLTRWRLASPRIPPGTGNRIEELDKAMTNGLAVFDLQAREAHLGSMYQSIARIELIERVDIDQAALRFSPFRNGRGIVARGFINAARIAPYAASQAARPQHA